MGLRLGAPVDRQPVLAAGTEQTEGTGMMTPSEILAALRSARRGKSIVYHVDGTVGRRDGTFRAAMGAYLAGLCVLVQARLGKDILAYRAIRTGQPVPVNLTAEALIRRAENDLKHPEAAA